MFLAEFGIFVIRFAGMSVVIYGFIKLPDYMINYLGMSQSHMWSIWAFVGMVLFPVGISLLIGLVLMWFPRGLLKRLFPWKDYEIIDDSFRMVLNDRSVILGLGLYLFVISFSEIAFYSSNFILILTAITGDIPLSAFNYPALIGSLAKLMMALVILSKSKWISGKFNGYVNKGVNKVNESNRSK